MCLPLGTTLLNGAVVLKNFPRGRPRTPGVHHGHRLMRHVLEEVLGVHERDVKPTLGIVVQAESEHRASGAAAEDHHARLSVLAARLRLGSGHHPPGVRMFLLQQRQRLGERGLGLAGRAPPPAPRAWRGPAPGRVRSRPRRRRRVESPRWRRATSRRRRKRVRASLGEKSVDDVRRGSSDEAQAGYGEGARGRRGDGLRRLLELIHLDPRASQPPPEPSRDSRRVANPATPRGCESP